MTRNHAKLPSMQRVNISTCSIYFHRKLEKKNKYCLDTSPIWIMSCHVSLTWCLVDNYFYFSMKRHFVGSQNYIQHIFLWEIRKFVPYITEYWLIRVYTVCHSITIFQNLICKPYGGVQILILKALSKDFANNSLFFFYFFLLIIFQRKIRLGSSSEFSC